MLTRQAMGVQWASGISALDTLKHFQCMGYNLVCLCNKPTLFQNHFLPLNLLHTLCNITVTPAMNTHHCMQHLNIKTTTKEWL